jgi:hypothetical protein
MSKQQNSETFRVGWWQDADFFIVPRVIYREWGAHLGANGLAVYSALASYADSGTGDAWPSLESLAANTGLTAKTVGESISDMATLGLIAKITVKSGTGKQERNEYTLLKPGSPTLPVENAPRFRRAAQRKTKRETGQVMITSRPSNDYSASQVMITAKPSNRTLGGQVIVTQELESEENKNHLNKNQGERASDDAPPIPPSSPSKVKASRKRAPALTPQEQAYYAETVPALAAACHVDLSVTGAWAQCQKQLRALYNAQTRPTADIIAREYGAPGGYWYAQDWRGMKGEPPTPHFVTNTWGAATTFKSATTPPARGNGAASKYNRSMEVLRRRMQPQPSEPEPPASPSGDVIIEGRVIRGNGQ